MQVNIYEAKTRLSELVMQAHQGQTVASFTKLMGKGEAASRRELMELRGDAIEVDV